MPAGCEFICKNKNCKHYDTGFVITAPWPMGKIQLVITAKQLQDNKEFINDLIKIKNNGKKYCCIPFPNIDKIPTEIYRIHMWSEQAKCIWEFEVNKEELEIYQTIVPKTCPKTGCQLKTFQEIYQDGITCWHCGEKLTQDRWFTNEN